MEALGRHGRVEGVSSLYETAPIGGPRQGPYLNAALLVLTSLEPRSLLDACLAIEAERGRERRFRWGARTLDIDVLLFGSLEIGEPGLTIPHPRLRRRRFALEPLVDVWPDAVLPDGTPAAAALAEVADQVVERLDAPDWWV